MITRHRPPGFQASLTSTDTRCSTPHGEIDGLVLTLPAFLAQAHTTAPTGGPAAVRSRRSSQQAVAQSRPGLETTTARPVEYLWSITPCEAFSPSFHWREFLVQNDIH